jgi:3-methyladenine DNA glycosylase/8-oxoguanine DNA glycosylase
LRISLGRIFYVEEKKEELQRLATYVFETFNRHNAYACKYIFCHAVRKTVKRFQKH